MDKYEYMEIEYLRSVVGEAARILLEHDETGRADYVALRKRLDEFQLRWTSGEFRLYLGKLKNMNPQQGSHLHEIIVEYGNKLEVLSARKEISLPKLSECLSGLYTYLGAMSQYESHEADKTEVKSS